MADPVCDFVPDACAALAIQSCILAKKCKLNELGIPGLEERLGGTKDRSSQLRLKLNEEAECVLEALRDAFDEAGCPFPPLPPAPSAPNLESCSNQMQAITDDANNPLGFLSSFMTIELDDNDKPTRITVP